MNNTKARQAVESSQVWLKIQITREIYGDGADLKSNQEAKPQVRYSDRQASV